jgi:regulator of sirC expression with transglutaminase-like and TPR domain
LLLARTVTPDLDIGVCCSELDAIAARCRELIADPSTSREKCRIINRVLFHEWGYRGNIENYTDPMNSLLDKVLIRRKGIPISLSVIYLLVAERLGLDLKPIGLPGHFVVGCFEEDSPFFVDPFEQGLFRDTYEVFTLLRASHVIPTIADIAPTPVREVLCRSCRNLVGHYAAAGDPDRARLFASFIEEFEAAYARQST